MLGDQRLELGDRLAVPAEREPGVEVVFDGGDPHLLQAADRLLRERLVAHVRQRRPVPERERFGEDVGRLPGPARGEVGAPARDQLLEARHVELAGCDARDVARSLRDDHARRGTIGLDHLAQLGHVALQRGRGRRRRRFAPDQVDQPVARDDLVGVQQQDRQHAALARPAERSDGVPGSRLDRSKEPKFRYPVQSATLPRPLAAS